MAEVPDNVKSVAECTDQYNANKYLELGWKLLAVATGVGTCKYVFGWTGDGPPPTFERIDPTMEGLRGWIEKQEREQPSPN